MGGIYYDRRLAIPKFWTNRLCSTVEAQTEIYDVSPSDFGHMKEPPAEYIEKVTARSNQKGGFSVQLSDKIEDRLDSECQDRMFNFKKRIADNFGQSRSVVIMSKH